MQKSIKFSTDYTFLHILLKKSWELKQTKKNEL